MIGEVALFGLFAIISIQDAIQNKIDDYFSGLLWICYVFLFPEANLFYAVCGFGLMILLGRYSVDCKNMGTIISWGDCLTVPILLSYVISLNGFMLGLIWLLLGSILGMVLMSVQKKDKVPMLPMLFIAFLMLEFVVITFLS